MRKTALWMPLVVASVLPVVAFSKGMPDTKPEVRPQVLQSAAETCVDTLLTSSPA